MPITVLFICGNPEQPHPCTALRADNGASFKIKNRVVVVVVHIWQTVIAAAEALLVLRP
jgi:hypothetical protein